MGDVWPWLMGAGTIIGVFILWYGKGRWFQKPPLKVLPIVPALDMSRDFKDWGYVFEDKSNWMMQSRVTGQEEFDFIGQSLSMARTKANRIITQTDKSQGGYFASMPYNKFVNSRGGVPTHLTAIVDSLVISPGGWPSLKIDSPYFKGYAAGAIFGGGIGDWIFGVAIKFLPRITDFLDPRMREYFAAAAYHEDEHFAIEQDPGRKAAQAAKDVHPIFIDPSPLPFTNRVAMIMIQKYDMPILVFQDANAWRHIVGIREPVAPAKYRYSADEK